MEDQRFGGSEILLFGFAGLFAVRTDAWVFARNPFLPAFDLVDCSENLLRFPAPLPNPGIQVLQQWLMMAARHGHFGMEELRQAVEAISQARQEIGAGPYNFHYSLKVFPKAVALTDSKHWSGR